MRCGVCNDDWNTAFVADVPCPRFSRLPGGPHQHWMQRSGQEHSRCVFLLWAQSRGGDIGCATQTFPPDTPLTIYPPAKVMTNMHSPSWSSWKRTAWYEWWALWYGLYLHVGSSLEDKAWRSPWGRAQCAEMFQRPWTWCEVNWWRDHNNPFWISGTALESTRRTTGGIRPPAFGVSMWYSRSLDHLVQGPPWSYPFSSVLCMTNGLSPSRAIPSSLLGGQWQDLWLVAWSCPASGQKSCCSSRKRGWQRCRRRWTSFKVPCFATCCSWVCRRSSQSGLWTMRRPWLECLFSISWWHLR